MSHCVPIVDGFSIPHAMKRMDIAGRDITEYLKQLLSKEGEHFTTSAEFEILRLIKEKSCFVSLNPAKEDINSVTKKESYLLPDGRTIKLGSERFKAPEILFNPQLVGNESLGIHQVALDAINRVDLDLRKSLFSNILLSGGATMTKGFGDRLLKQVKKEAYKDVPVKIYAPPERMYSTWVGGSILASLCIGY